MSSEFDPTIFLLQFPEDDPIERNLKDLEKVLKSLGHIINRNDSGIYIERQTARGGRCIIHWDSQGRIDQTHRYNRRGQLVHVGVFYFDNEGRLVCFESQDLLSKHSCETTIYKFERCDNNSLHYNVEINKSGKEPVYLKNQSRLDDNGFNQAWI